MSSSSLNLKPKQNFTINISPRQPEKFAAPEKTFENEKKAINSEKKYFQEKNEKPSSSDKFFKLLNEKSLYDGYNVDKNEKKSNFGIEKPEKKANPEKTLRCVIDENCPKKPLTLKKTSSERKPDQNQENNKIDELANLRHQRRSNTQFIEDMKSNISMQFEKLKEFKVTRTNFQRVLQEKENELDMNIKERTAFDENDYRINYSQDKLPNDYQSNFKQQVMQNDYKFNVKQEKNNLTQDKNNLEKNNLTQEKNKEKNNNNKSSDYKNNKLCDYKNILQEQESDNKSNYSQCDYKNRQTEQERQCDYKNIMEYKNNYTQEKQREDKKNYTEEKQRNNYTEEKQTIRKEAKKDDEIMNYRKKHTEETAGNNKYSKSISCHFFNKKENGAEEEEYEGKISNKFSSNKTSSYLYGQMKIQEKRTEIDEKVMILKQKINRAKKDGNTQIKEIYKLFEELNECYQSLII